MARPITLVLLPGLDGTEIFFRPLLAALPTSVRPVVVTYPLAGDQGYATLLGLVRRQITDIPECVVLGWSFAGPLALMLAAAEPRKVRGIILVASFVRTPRRILRGLRPVLIPPVIWLWRFCRRLPLWLLRPPGDPLRQAKTETWTRIPAQVLAARLRVISRTDVRETLGLCRQPLCYLASASDFFVPPANADEIRRLRPDVRTATIPGTHLALHHNPQPAVAVLEDFLSGLGTGEEPVVPA